jgi:hypothetical protein
MRAALLATANKLRRLLSHRPHEPATFLRMPPGVSNEAESDDRLELALRKKGCNRYGV